MEVELCRVLDALPGMVFTALADGRIDFMNRALTQYIGLSGSWSDRAWPVAAPAKEVDELTRRWQSLVSRGDAFEIIMPTPHADGGSRCLRLRCNPMREHDRVVKWCGWAIETSMPRSHSAERAAQIDGETGEQASRASENETKLTLENIPAGIGVLGADGDVKAINGHLQKYYGRTLDELRNWGDSDVVHPDDMTRVTEAVKGAVAKGSAYDVEVRLRRADGAYRWFQVIGHPLKVDNGGIVRWYALHIDIDERKQAEEALKSNELELRKIINALPLTVWTSRPDGYCDFVNDRWLAYVGLTADQAEGWGWTGVIHPDDASHLASSWNVCLASGLPADFEARMRGSDGEYRWFLFRAMPFRDGDGKIIKWYGTHIDIEDRKQAEGALWERERESRLIVDGIAGMIAIFAPDGQLIDGNQQIVDYFKLPLSTLNNWATNGITHPDDLQLCVDSFMASIATGKPYDYETRFLRHDGAWRWFQLRGLPLRDADGRIDRWYGLLTDIDDRKRTEEHLRRNEAFLADAQRLSKTGSFLLNLATGELIWSAETYRIFDVDPSTQVTLHTVLSSLNSESLPTVEGVIAKAHEGDADFDFEIALVTLDRTLKHIRVLAHSAKNKNGDQELIGALLDITESRNAEDALNKARSELSYVTRVTSLGVLTASIAHELNQPLAGIVANASTYLRVLATDPPDLDVARDTARRMIRDANRAADVIVRLRALFSRKPPLMEAIDINDVAGEVIALLSSHLQRARTSMTTDFETNLPRVAGARVQLQQVIANLLRNAIEALSDVTDRPRRILLKTQASSGEIKLSIEDTGSGFGVQGAAGIFDAFYTTKPEGMGIGLSVSRSIIESHNGRLWAIANAGHGVTVGFTVPTHTVRRTSDGSVEGDVLTADETAGRIS
ncbi:PAS domain-containing protein [Mesorhizobium erdmanii]|uniref:PAS domain-containing protein n=1 Tax=Mesorhizobium erdmanii TaxID=1777866 RepID=UPI0009DD3772|nr:PAS domain-containing protein [Mesorhizobium erdmanii]